MIKANAASSPTTTKRTPTKSTVTAAKSRARAPKEATLKEEASPVTVEPRPDLVAVLTDRLGALEEKIATSLATVLAEIQALKTAPTLPSADGHAPQETFLPVVADLIRRNLMEQVTPVIASLKRLEERVGFIGNRLKQPPSGGQEHRQKPWRHDQQQRHNRPRGGPRPTGQQGPPWAPPSAASVQGHFAPRPLHGGESGLPKDDED